VFAVWIGVDINVPYPHLGTRAAFDPTSLEATAWGITFLVVRLYGLVLMVPVMEELFWRSFLLRYLVNPDFRRVPIGTFTPSALAISVVLFGVEHNQWFAGIVAGLLYTLLLYRTKSLFSCIVAHTVTNFLLGIYVLTTEHWQYW